MPTETKEMSTEQLADLGKIAAEMFKDPDAKRRLVAAFAGKTKAQANNSQPYYKPKFAERIRPVIEEMLADSESRIVLYSDYRYVNKTTLYLMHQQSIKYLGEQVPELLGVHNKIAAAKGKTGILLRFADQTINATAPIKAHKLGSHDVEGDKVDESTVTINRVRNFLDSPTHGALKIEGANLTMADMDHIETLLSACQSSEGDNLMYKIEGNDIKIVRLKDRDETN